MQRMLTAWRERLRGHLERPPDFVRPERRDDYLRHVGEALAVVERTLVGGRVLDEDGWERVRTHMRAAAWCAFAEPETAVEEADPEPASGVREVAAVSSEPPVSLRRIIGFIRRAVNS